MSSDNSSWQVGEVAVTETDLKDTKTKKLLTAEDLASSVVVIRVTKPDGGTIEPPIDIEGTTISCEYELTEAGEWDRHLIVTGQWRTKRPLGKLTVGAD